MKSSVCLPTGCACTEQPIKTIPGNIHRLMITDENPRRVQSCHLWWSLTGSDFNTQHGRLDRSDQSRPEDVQETRSLSWQTLGFYGEQFEGIKSIHMSTLQLC